MVLAIRSRESLNDELRFAFPIVRIKTNDAAKMLLAKTPAEGNGPYPISGPNVAPAYAPATAGTAAAAKSRPRSARDGTAIDISLSYPQIPTSELAAPIHSPSAATSASLKAGISSGCDL